MLSRDTLRPDVIYWVQKRDANKQHMPTLALLYGELPTLSIKVLDSALYPCCSDYDFLAVANFDAMWDATFKGTTLGEIRAAGRVKVGDA